LVTTDVYGTLIIEYQGADLETRTQHLYPEGARALGAFAQDPAGWLQRYFRPNPDSTGGIFSLVAFTGGWQGAVWPYVPSIVVKVHLPLESTQKSAFISGTTGTIAITDTKAFIRSLRRVLDPKSSLKIDPVLLSTGPAEFREAK